MDYRAEIYAKYASVVRGVGKEFDIEQAERCAVFSSFYLRGWLPADKNAVILDAGCGCGRLLYFLKKQGFCKIQGVDASPEQVQLARQVTSNVETGNVLEFLTNRREAFDLITAIDVIEHLTKPEALEFLKSCHDALRPGGRLILQTPNGDSPFFADYRYGDVTHEICLTPESLTRLLLLFHFRDVETREQGPVPHGVKSGLRYAAWRCLRKIYQAVNLVEIGSPGSGVYTRGFLATAVKG